MSSYVRVRFAVLLGLLAALQAPSRADLYVASGAIGTLGASGVIAEFDNSGHFITDVYSGAPPPLGLAFGPDGRLYESPQYVNYISALNTSAGALVPFTTGGSLANVDQITFGGPHHDLYVSDLSNGIWIFDGHTGAFKSMIPPPGQGTNGVAVDSTGDVYFTDLPGEALYKNVGGVTSLIASPGIPLSGLTIGPDGNLYVGTRLSEVLRYKPDGTPFGAGGNTSDPGFITDGRPNLAMSLAFGPDGNIYVVSSQSDEILRYDPSGNFIDTFVPALVGGVTYPSYIAFGSAPEPGALLPLGLGLVAVFGLRRFRPRRSGFG